jgi:4-hydroxyacetophenone monooxygenase
MSQKQDPTGLGIHDDDATIAAALEEASIPCLIMSMIHMSGDTSLLDGDNRPLGVYINEFQGYMDEDSKAAIRSRALDIIREFRDGNGVLPPPPGADTLHRMMEFLVAQEVPRDYVPMMLEELELDGEDQRGADWAQEISDGKKREMHVTVIGGGISGVLAAIRLAEAGIPFTVFEKNQSVGGTWFENRYPGARVDVANHLYSYSFEPAHHWTEFFSQQPELQTYFENCIDKYGVRDNFRFGTEVVCAGYDEQQQCWNTVVRDSDGSEETVTSCALISAVGQLNRPSIPDIPGLDSFEGPHFHSADWHPDTDISNKRIAVIGTGASAFQLVPELAKQAAEVTVFQRTANWMFENPIYHEKVSAGKKWCLEHLPFYARWFRFLIFWPAIDGAWEVTVVDPDWPHQDRSINEANDMVREMFAEYIKSQVGDDEELLAKVMPDHAPMGKRMLQDNGTWLAALKSDNVTLVNSAVSGIGPNSITAESGESCQADIVVFATGFKANKFLWPMAIRGRNGALLSEQWGEEPAAYLGITVPNFPNFFLCYGPGTNLAFGGSIIFNIECQVRYIMDALHTLLEQDKQEIECDREVFEEYYQRFRNQHAQMIWEHPSIKHSFYTNDQGKCTLLWPWKILQMWQWTRKIDPKDYHVT